MVTAATKLKDVCFLERKNMTNLESESVSFSFLSNSLQPHGVQPTRLLYPWDFPGKNTGVGCHFLLQGNLPHLGIEPVSPTLQADSLPSEPPGKTLFNVLLFCEYESTV